MSDPSSTPNLNPDGSFTQPSPSVSQAATDLRNAATEKAREFVQTAEEKAAVLKDKAVETAQQLRDTATERAAQFKTVATEKAQQFKETATEQWDDTRVKAKEIQITAEDYIRQNPTKCVLSAIGAGFLVGLLARR